LDFVAGGRGVEQYGTFGRVGPKKINTYQNHQKYEIINNYRSKVERIKSTHRIL